MKPLTEREQRRLDRLAASYTRTLKAFVNARAAYLPVRMAAAVRQSGNKSEEFARAEMDCFEAEEAMA